MEIEEFNAYLKSVMRMADYFHAKRNDSVLLTLLSAEMERNDLTGWQRRQVYNAATSYLRP